MAIIAKAKRVFLKLLRQFTEEGRRVNHSGSSTYAPKVFADHQGAEGCNKRALKTAMDSLLSDGRVMACTDGPPSRRCSFLAVRVEE